MKAKVLTLICIVLFWSCTTASEDDLIDTTPLEDIITYVDDVKSIMDNNCIFCHSEPPENGAPMPLLSYEQVKEAVENRDLIERISTEDLAFVMPFGGPRLPQNLIDIVIKWQTDGLLED